MTRTTRELPGSRPIPKCYELREASASDVSELARLMQITFDESWVEAKVNERLLQNARVPKTYLVCHQDQIVAGASYLTRDEFPEVGWVHFVAADPEHSGKGLGYIVTRCVIEESLTRKNGAEMLTTDDPRLPAIATYLKLGFEPDSWHESHPDRWRTVMEQLRQAEPSRIGAK